MALLHLVQILILIGIQEKFSFSTNNCSPWPDKSRVQCIGFIPQFSVNDSMEHLILRRCQPGLKLNKTLFCNLNNLKRLDILCEFASTNQELVFEEKVFTGVARSLKWLYLDNNNIRLLPDQIFCNTRNYWIILSRNRLVDITKIGFSYNVCGKNVKVNRLTVLILRNNLLTNIQNNTFDMLKLLKALDLSHNHLHEIENNAFLNLRSLSTLDLSYNNLSYIPHELLENSTTIQALLVSHNKLNSRSISVLGQISSRLAVLNVAGNVIEVIDENSFSGKFHLRSLDLSYNPLTITGKPFETLTELQHLYLNNVGLNQLHMTIFSNLSKLTRLYLMNNELRYLDENRLFESLKEIHLSGNRFTTVPKLNVLNPLIRTIVDGYPDSSMDYDYYFYNNFDPSYDIQFVYDTYNIYDDKLYSLSKTALNNKVLDKMALDRGLIETLKTYAFAGVDITDSCVNLDNNFITEIDSNFSELWANNISIAFNKIQTLNLEYITIWAQVLNASHNEIRVLRKSNKILNLISIDLSNNQITRVTYQNFQGNFHNVYLHNNLIKDFSLNLLSYRLKLLTLHGNKLKHLHLLTENYNYNLMQLSVTVSANPLVCSCELQLLTKLDPFETDNQLISITDLDKVECEVPFTKSAVSTKIHVKGNRQHENFLCKSNNTHPNSCKYLDTKSWCLMPCPELCTCYHNAEHSFLILDCARQNLSILPDIRDQNLIEFRTMIVYFDGSFMGKLSPYNFTSYLNATKLFLNNSAISEVDEGTFDKLGKLVELHLENNNIKNLPELLFSNLTKLRELHLSNNRISHLGLNAFTSLNFLEILTIAHNNLNNFPIWDLQSRTLQNLAITGNTFVCECTYATKYRGWLQQGQYPGNRPNFIKDAEKLTCNVTSTKFVPIITYELEYCQDHLHIWLPPIAGFIFLTVVCICVFVYRHELQVMIYAKYGFRIFSTEDVQDDESKKYDIFLSYSSLDNKFVVKRFLPKLEKIDNSYRVCLHERDFIIGEHIINNIIEAVQNSKITVVLLSPNFVTSSWCKFEFQVAHSQMIEDKCKRLVMIVKDEPPSDQLDPEMKLYMRTNTYLKWGDSQFWDKLYFSLPDARLVQTNPVCEV